MVQTLKPRSVPMQGFDRVRPKSDEKSPKTSQKSYLNGKIDLLGLNNLVGGRDGRSFRVTSCIRLQSHQGSWMNRAMGQTQFFHTPLFVTTSVFREWIF
jgi:hypothetical protein